MTERDKVHPDISKPTSVTHFICPDHPTVDAEKQPAATHHLVNGKCMHCQFSRSDLAKRNGVQ